MAQLVGNTAIDGSSARKYYYFLKLMDGSTTGGKVPTSHVALEVALETKPNLLLLTEEVDDHRNNLREIVSGIADVISARADDGKNFGTVVVAEGLLAAIPEFRTLIAELEAHFCRYYLHGNNAGVLALACSSCHSKVLPELTTWSAALFRSLPEFIQKQLLLERQSNAALQLSQLETERLMAWLVEDELKQRKKKGTFKGSFSPVCHRDPHLDKVRKRAQFQQFEDMDPRDWKDVAWAEWRKHNTMLTQDERTVDASPTSPTVKIASILKSRADEMPFGDTFSSDPDGRSRLSSKAGHEAFEASDASGSMIKVTALLRNKINYSDKMERKTNKMTDKSDSNKVPEKADSNKMTEKSQGNAASLDGAYSRSSSRANRKEVTLVDVPKPPEVKDRPAPPHPVETRYQEVAGCTGDDSTEEGRQPLKDCHGICKNWEEVYLLLAPLGADCTVAFTFYLLFFTLGVLNIITGVFALQESMRQVQEDIEQVTAILEAMDPRREVHKLGFELHRVLSLIQQMCVEQGEIKVERQEGPEEVKNNSTLREGLYEEFLKHQRDMQKRAEGRGSSSLFSGPFNFRAVMHSMRKVAPKDLWASEAGHHSTSRACAAEELYENPGPIQLSGSSASRVTKTIATRFSYLRELRGLQRHLETLSVRCRPGCDLRQVKIACQSLATLNTILDELSEHPAASPFLERAMKEAVGRVEEDVSSLEDFERAWPPPEGAVKLREQLLTIESRVRDIFKPLHLTKKKENGQDDKPEKPPRPPPWPQICLNIKMP
eukprot:g12421.t1